MKLKYVLNVLLFTIILILFFGLINYFFKNSNNIEGLDNPDMSIIMNGSDSFCEANKESGGNLEKSCNKLTQGNCNSTSCCVWTSDNKCKSGSAKGPTFNTDENGKTKKLDYYYFQSKCYGAGCPTTV
jgi:hypothetical protein